MSWDDFLNDPSFDSGGWNGSDPGNTFDPYNDPAEWGDPTSSGNQSFDWGSLLNPTLLRSLAGGLGGSLGPLFSLLGGGRTPSSSANRNTSENQNFAGNSNQLAQFLNSLQQQGQQFGQQQFGQNSSPQLFPWAQGGGSNALNLLNFMGPQAMQSYGMGSSLLNSLGPQFAMGQDPMQQRQSGLLGGLENYLQGSMTRSQGGMGDFPTGGPDPSAYMGTVQRAFEPVLQNLATNSINAARNAGFAGGADLLDNAAAPIMGPALAQVPGQEAATALNFANQAYGAQSANAAAKAAATNQQLNSIMSGGLGLAGAYNTPIGQRMAGLSQITQQMMNPLGTAISGNTGLLGGPFGTNTQGYGNSNQFNNQSANQMGQNSQQGSQSGNSFGSGNMAGSLGGQIPLMNLIGQLLSGGITGAAAGAMPPMNIQSLLQALGLMGGGQRSSLSGVM